MPVETERRPESMEEERELTPEEYKEKIAELQALYLTAFREARTDFKTNLPNMRAFAESATERRQQNRKLSILILDIDNLKELNKKLTNPGVDQKIFAQMDSFFKSKFKRKYDRVFRHGGDEFVIVFEGDEDDVARRFYDKDARKSQIHFETTSNGEPIGEPVTVTFSGGVADFEGEDAKAIEQAFLATNEAKARGRDQIIKHSDIKESATMV